MNKLHKEHKKAAFNQQASKWQAKEYFREYREFMKWDAHFYELPLYKGTKYRGRKRWLNKSDIYRRTKWVGIVENYPKPQGKSKNEVLI